MQKQCCTGWILILLVAMLSAPISAEARHYTSRQSYAKAVQQLPASQKTLYRFKGMCTGNCSIMRSNQPLPQFGIQQQHRVRRYRRLPHRSYLSPTRRVYRTTISPY